MSLERRVLALEQFSTTPGTECCCAAAAGAWAEVLLFNAEPEPEASVCPGCGAYRRLRVLHIREEVVKVA